VIEEETMTTPEAPQNLRDWGLSWIRTGVPVLWGYLLTFLATRFPAIHELLGNPAIMAAVVGAVTLVWYAVVRWLEPRLPAWLTRIVIGANTPPQYVEGQVLRSTVEEFEGDGPPDPLPPAGPGVRLA
jgi:hypothetical protein